MALSVSENASLQRLNSFGVQARARRLVAVEDAADLDAALAVLAGESQRLILGGGSNLLFTGDFDGTVLHVRTRGRRVLADTNGSAIVEAEAGESWDGFVRWTLACGLGGLENLSLIPGTVGASPIQNIGAYGVEMRESFHGLSAVRIGDGERREFGAPDCAFGYRDSVFKHDRGAGWLITRVRFRLSRGASPRLDHGELREELARRGVHGPSAIEVADAVCALRHRKLPDPATLGNAGSFFKNPVVAPSIAQTLAQRHPGLPAWPAGPLVKLSAAWMIDRCGWKGHRDGDAGVHARHALVLVNHGAATGAQILALAQRIRESVQASFGVSLETEPVIVGPHGP